MAGGHTLECVDTTLKAGRYNTCGTHSVVNSSAGQGHASRLRASASLPSRLPGRSTTDLLRDKPTRGANRPVIPPVRLAQLRSSQRTRAEREYELAQAFNAPRQWWQSVQSQQRAAQLALWALEAFRQDTPKQLALLLRPVADAARKLPGQCHEDLQHHLREYAVVAGRLRRFALLCTQPVVHRLSTQEERRTILLRLLGALRVAMTGAVEGVLACHADQKRHLAHPSSAA